MKINVRRCLLIAFALLVCRPAPGNDLPIGWNPARATLPSMMSGSLADPLPASRLTSLRSALGESQTLRQVDYSSVGESAGALCCAPPPWSHRSGFFADLLVLRARDADVAYALPVNANVPEGSAGVIDPEFDLGLRLGAVKAIDPCHSLAFTYSGFFSGTTDSVTANAPFSLQKLLVHPNEANANSNVPRSLAEQNIDFHLVDVDFRFVVLSNERTAANFLMGVRYGHLNQELQVDYLGGGLSETISSDIRFNGVGLRLGLDLEHHTHHGLFCYGRSAASFLAGEFEAEYLHSSSVDPVRAQTSWDAGRIVPMLDLEVGFGMQCTQSVRCSAGYMLSSWYNSVSGSEWVNTVRTSSLQPSGDTITFDGFVGRIELLF